MSDHINNDRFFHSDKLIQSEDALVITFIISYLYMTENINSDV